MTSAHRHEQSRDLLGGQRAHPEHDLRGDRVRFLRHRRRSAAMIAGALRTSPISGRDRSTTSRAIFPHVALIAARTKPTSARLSRAVCHGTSTTPSPSRSATDRRTSRASGPAPRTSRPRRTRTTRRPGGLRREGGRNAERTRRPKRRPWLRMSSERQAGRGSDPPSRWPDAHRQGSPRRRRLRS